MNVEVDWLVPCGTVTGPQVRTPTEIPHDPPQPEPWEAIVQDSPAWAGSTSVRVTSLASPVPLFETVNVNPIGSPAFTTALSGVLTMSIAGPSTGPCTQVDAVDSPEPAFDVDTSPVFETTPLPPGQPPPVAAAVGDVICTVNVLDSCDVPAGTVTPLEPPQDSTPEAIAHVPPQPAP